MSWTISAAVVWRECQAPSTDPGVREKAWGWELPKKGAGSSQWFCIRDTGILSVTGVSFLNGKAGLDQSSEHKLGSAKQKKRRKKFIRVLIKVLPIFYKIYTPPVNSTRSYKTHFQYPDSCHTLCFLKF